MTYLVDHLTLEAAPYLQGITVSDSARAQIDKMFGHRRLAIMTTIHQLVRLNLVKGMVFDQVEALAQELRHTKTCLEAVKS